MTNYQKLRIAYARLIGEYEGAVSAVQHYVEDEQVKVNLKKLEEKLKKQADEFVNEEVEVPSKRSRCCGRCDGVNDLCVADTVCDAHEVLGCEVCFGLRDT